MPVDNIVGVINGISTGLLAIGAAVVVLTLALAGLCMMFAWMDTHIGGFIKKVFLSVIGGGAMMASSGALGLWFASQFALGGGAPTPAP